LRNSAFNLDEYGLMAADVDGNGSVSSLDLTYLKRYILRRISDFPANKKIFAGRTLKIAKAL